MHESSLAGFDRWLTRGTAARRASPRPTLPTRHLIGPGAVAALPLPCDAGPAEILRAAHGIEAGDWLGLLADEAQRGTAGRGLSQTWRLALWRAGRDGGGLVWIGAALSARPGQSAAALRSAALGQAVQELWAQGWRLLEAADGARTRPVLDLQE
ncbi:MAG TPA: hypothetical protein VJN44_10280 [Roseateles sp.]|nr:hypothetical protein [Roseateles sp.]